jgi:hypothetical protein
LDDLLTAITVTFNCDSGPTPTNFLVAFTRTVGAVINVGWWYSEGLVAFRVFAFDGNRHDRKRKCPPFSTPRTLP